MSNKTATILPYGRIGKRFTARTYHDISSKIQVFTAVDHLVPHPPLLEAVQDLHIVQIQSREHALDHADFASPARQHELDHTDHTDRSGMDSFSLKGPHCRP